MSTQHKQNTPEQESNRISIPFLTPATTKLGLLTTPEAAEYLGVSDKTMTKWRSIGTPMIPYARIGRCIRYRLSDLDNYLSKNTFNKVEG